MHGEALPNDSLTCDRCHSRNSPKADNLVCAPGPRCRCLPELLVVCDLRHGSPAVYAVWERSSGSLRGLLRIAQLCTAAHNELSTPMRTDSRNEDDLTRLERCIACNAMVVGWVEGYTVCATCGMTLLEPPFDGSDYFNMIMRPDRHLGRSGHRRRRE